MPGSMRHTAILRMFQTGAEPTGTAWLAQFLALRNEATAYSERFVEDSGGLVAMAKDVNLNSSVLTNINKVEVQQKEAAKAAIIQRKKEILKRRGDLSASDREALERLVTNILVDIDKQSRLKENVKRAVLQERDWLSAMQDTLELDKERAMPAARAAVAKLPAILAQIDLLPDPQTERVQRAFGSWKHGLKNLLGACHSYIRWHDSGDIQFLTGILYPGPSVSSGISGYILGCGSRRIWEAATDVAVKRSFQNQPQNETMLELLQPFCDEDIISQIPRVIRLTY